MLGPAWFDTEAGDDLEDGIANEFMKLRKTPAPRPSASVRVEAIHELHKEHHAEPVPAWTPFVFDEEG